MPPPRKPRKRRQRRGAHDPRNVRIQGQHAILTNNRQTALNLQRARKMGGGGSSGGGGGGGASDDLGRRLREAAEVIAAQARENAQGWSVQVPPSIKVSGGSRGVSILSGAPPSYPNEVENVWHPVFGGRGTRRPKAPWRQNKHRPFLAPAADQRGDEALQKFAQVIDDWAKEHGYRGARLRVKIDYDGRLWDFDLEEMDVAQCEAVEKYVGKGLGEWANQMSAGGVKAVVALWWVMRVQAGDDPGPAVTAPAGFRPVKLLAAFHAADVAAEEPEPEPDPTRTPTAGSPATADGTLAAPLPG